MDYREIVAVTGMGGLYQLKATKNDGAIVRNLDDNTVKFLPARLHTVTPLESIEVYTISDNVRLHEVFLKMKENEGVAKPNIKTANNNDIKAYFKGIFPEFDEERVYVSDMKKMLKWFEVLQKNDMLHFEKVNEAATPEAAPVEVAEEEKPAKKTKAKKTDDDNTPAEEKPKKTTKKKKTEE